MYLGLFFFFFFKKKGGEIDAIGITCIKQKDPIQNKDPKRGTWTHCTMHAKSNRVNTNNI